MREDFDPADVGATVSGTQWRLDPDASEEAELDAAILRSWGSDRRYVAIRLVTLAVVFGAMAWGIHAHRLTASLLLIPMAVELLSILWGGVILSAFVVDCQKFAKTVVLKEVTIWTGLIAGVVFVILALDGGSLREVVETGLVWALVAEMVGLVTATVPDVLRWRAVGGTFIWTPSLSVGIRFVALVVTGFVAFFLVGFLQGELGVELFSHPGRTAWMCWTLLLCVELGALGLGVKIHETVQREELAKRTAVGGQGLGDRVRLPAGKRSRGGGADAAVHSGCDVPAIED